MNKSNFKNVALALFLYTVLVILWGAWVRISHSGNGCGDTWPLCHGQIIPEAQRGKTWVEYTHRLMSGLYGFFVIYFYYLARRFFSKNSLTRKASFWVFIFMISEALLGAKLVLFRLVGDNDTPFRAFAMALHQVNSLLLAGAVILAYTSAADDDKNQAPANSVGGLLQNRSWIFPLFFFIIAVTGAWASLATTLFPSQSLLQGFNEDFATDSHYLIRLRMFHPFCAIILGSGLAAYFWYKSQNAKSLFLQRTAAQTSFVLLGAIAFGISTLLALSPVWMKITHLTLVHIVWFFILRSVYALQKERRN